MNAPLQLLGRLISSALAPDRVPVPHATAALTEKEWLVLIQVANTHRLVPAIGGALRLHGDAIAIPSDVRDYFVAIYEQNKLRNEALRDQLSSLIVALNTHGIEPLLLKGMAELFIPRLPDPEMRFVGDIDLLIPESDLERAVEIALSLGYRPRAGEMTIAPGEHHYPALFHPECRAAVEIHRTLGRKRFVNRFHSAELFARARRRSQDGMRFLVLNETDAAVYLAYHTQLHHLNLDGEIRGARHLDLLALNLLGAGEIDPATVEKWFAKHEVMDALQVELALIREIFGFEAKGFSPLSASAERRARFLVRCAQERGIRRFWRTFFLLYRGLSPERFEHDTGGGNGAKLFVWRLKRLFQLTWKYINPVRILRLSR